jgi:hypothetical protein
MAQKYRVSLIFPPLTQAEFLDLSVVFYNKGAGVTYHNHSSGLTFFGYPLVAEDEFLKGNLFLKTMNVTIEQA